MRRFAAAGRSSPACWRTRSPSARWRKISPARISFSRPVSRTQAPADALFPPLTVFVPRWQVSRMGDGSVAVANLLVGPGLPFELMAEKLWKAHAKFRAFDYRAATNRDRPSAPTRITEEVPAMPARRLPAGGRARRLAEIAAAAHLRKDRPRAARPARLTTAGGLHPLRRASGNSPAPALPGLLCLLRRQRPWTKLHRRQSRAARAGRRRTHAHRGAGRLRAARRIRE